MTQTSTNHKCTYSPRSGPEGCLPAPNIFPLAKETFAEGKMFWNFILWEKSIGELGPHPQLENHDLIWNERFSLNKK